MTPCPPRNGYEGRTDYTVLERNSLGALTLANVKARIRRQ